MNLFRCILRNWPPNWSTRLIPIISLIMILNIRIMYLLLEMITKRELSLTHTTWWCKDWRMMFKCNNKWIRPSRHLIVPTLEGNQERTRTLLVDWRIISQWMLVTTRLRVRRMNGLLRLQSSRMRRDGLLKLSSQKRRLPQDWHTRSNWRIDPTIQIIILIRDQNTMSKLPIISDSLIWLIDWVIQNS